MLSALWFRATIALRKGLIGNSMRFEKKKNPMQHRFAQGYSDQQLLERHINQRYKEKQAWKTYRKD
jgi:hypothetical protein